MTGELGGCRADAAHHMPAPPLCHKRLVLAHVLFTNHSMSGIDSVETCLGPTLYEHIGPECLSSSDIGRRALG